MDAGKPAEDFEILADCEMGVERYLLRHETDGAPRQSASSWVLAIN